MKWWSPPKQRQRWNSSQILPSDNWGQIFFDLFYVGGAYNLGNVLKISDSLGPRTLLYFCAAGFPSMVMWYDKLYFDARFTTRPGHDAFHRFLEILQLCCVASALSRIRSVEVESHPCDHIDIFEFSVALFLNSLLTIGRYVEVLNFVEGDPGARVVAKRDILCRIIPTMLLLVATISSGNSYFGISDNGGDEDECAVNEKPVWFCLASWLSTIIIGYCSQILFAPKGKRQCIEETSVPSNVHFCMHRYGEWFMLMFGESIMSLLIVEGDNESWNHNLKFYAGILSVTLLAQLHFKSEPLHNEDHALSRSRSSHYLYTALLVPIYSMALIATGICYKMFLYDYYQDGGNYNNQRRLDSSYNYGDNDDHDDHNDDNSYYEQMEEHQQDTANLFSRSLVLVLICADVNYVLHQGRQAIWDQCRNIPMGRFALLFLSKYSLLFFLAAMSSFQNDPHLMAIIGLGAILFQEFLQRSFLAWQQQETVMSNIADDIINSGTTESGIDVATRATHSYTSFILGDVKVTTKYSLDDNYEYEIERFENAESALAKFEQQSTVDEDEVKPQLPLIDLHKQLSDKLPSNKKSSQISTDSYYAID